MKEEIEKATRAARRKPRYGGPTLALWGQEIPLGADVVTIDESGLNARFFFVCPPSRDGGTMGVETCVSQ